MNEAGKERYLAFDLFGRVADHVGVDALREAVDFARGEWAEGRPGPVISSPDEVVPPYSIILGEDLVSIRWGQERGSLPVEALAGLMNAEAQRA
ncbi:MAG TPA: hypothetical protein VLF62_01155 [Candidatus Saccharimonadales bacterium]|jgi:hypothetical protein|nr:hypothetical protein [Candidatus Saccharimonadales bacterium]